MSVEQIIEGAVAPDELLARARELVPLLRSNIQLTERLCNPAPENLDALRAAGLFRLATPPSYGGHNISMRSQVEIISEVGRGCPSTGWIVANHAASAEFTLLLPETGLKEVFGDNPDVVILSAGSVTASQAKRVTGGGLSVSGRFPYSSGCEISDWALLIGVPLFDGDREVGAVDALIRCGEAEIERTWKVAGMLGTGTQSMVVTDVFVPEHRSQIFQPDGFVPLNQGGRLEELLSPTGLTRGNLHSLSALVGAARGAHDIVRATLAKNRPIAYSTYARAVDSPAIQLWFTMATHLIDTAFLHMNCVADEFDAIPHDEEMTRVTRARARMHSASALERAREGMQKLLDVAGTGGFALVNPLQQYWRDLEVGSRHAMLGLPIIVEDYSRALLDVGPTIAQFH